ncbi:MAG: hypothetical protein AABY22_21500 [Nanoarchaeota archaeon]
MKKELYKNYGKDVGRGENDYILIYHRWQVIQFSNDWKGFIDGR